MHRREHRRRRREGRKDRTVAPAGQRAEHADGVVAFVVNDGIHGDDVIEAAKCRIEHVADAEIDRAVNEGRRPVACEVDQCRGDIDRHDIGATTATSTASAPVPQPASSTRAPRMSCGNHDRSIARIASRPSRTVARMRPTGASEVKRFQASTAVRSK